MAQILLYSAHFLALLVPCLYFGTMQGMSMQKICPENIFDAALNVFEVVGFRFEFTGVLQGKYSWRILYSGKCTFALYAAQGTPGAISALRYRHQAVFQLLNT